MPSLLHARDQNQDGDQMLALLLLLHHLLLVDGLQMLLQLFMTLSGRPPLLFQILSIKFKVLVFIQSLLVMTIKLLFLIKPNRLLDQKVISNNTGTGLIKKLQLNGTLMVLVPLTTLPMEAPRFNLRHPLDGTLLLLFSNNKLELDGLNSLCVSLKIVTFLLQLIFQTLLKQTASGDHLHLDLDFLEIVWTHLRNI